jgi:hypothetical protein
MPSNLKDNSFMQRLLSRTRSSFVPALIQALLLLSLSSSVAVLAQTPATRTPTETVSEFYKALREKRFREAFAISTLKGAVEGLGDEEFEELRPDFEKMATAAEKIVATGEQVSGDTASVFVKASDAAATEAPDEVTLMRVGGVWIVGDQATQEAVKKEGKKYFFNLRINTHHSEVQNTLRRIMVVELAYQQHSGGVFTDLQGLISAGLIDKDIEETESTGYRFHITLLKDGKSYVAGAEPVRYGRTGRFSFFLDPTGIRSADVGGKPLTIATIQKQ